MKTKNIPTEGQTVWVSGHEFTATNVRVVPNTNRPATTENVVRFEGICTPNPVNDSIRHTSYNGGCYGWVIENRN